MKIVYLFDIVCPWCYIGKKYFDNIDISLKNKIANITWQPYFLNPNLTLKGINRKDQLSSKFGGENNANYIYKNIYIAGKKANIEFNFDAIKIMPNSLNIMYLITLIKNHNTASLLIDQLFKAFFEKGENIGDIKILSKYAVKYLESFNLSIFDNNKNKNYLLIIDQEFKNKGISAVPGIIVDEKYFISGAVKTQKLNLLLKKSY